MSHISPLKTSMRYRVPYADTDQMGVVYYANYLVYFERLRNEMLREQYVPYKEIEGRGLMLPVTEAMCFYHRPAHYDDLLVLTGWFEMQSPIRVRALCEVHRDGVLLASGHTVHVCMDIHKKKPTRFPGDFPGFNLKAASPC